MRCHFLIANLMAAALCRAMTLRLKNATLHPSHLDAIAKVVVESQRQEPDQNYKYPETAKYPEDAFRCSRADYVKYIRNDEQKWACVLTEKVEEDGSAEVIAVSLWQVKAIPELAHRRPEPEVSKDQRQVPLTSDDKDKEPCVRRDADQARLKAWGEALGKFREDYMVPSWGPYLHLQYIGTHPDYQRRGAASLLMQWGLDLAREHDLWTGLFASPEGKFLYEHFGFETLGNVTVQVPGEVDKTEVTPMGKSPKEATAEEKSAL